MSNSSSNKILKVCGLPVPSGVAASFAVSIDTMPVEELTATPVVAATVELPSEMWYQGYRRIDDHTHFNALNNKSGEKSEMEFGSLANHQLYWFSH